MGSADQLAGTFRAALTAADDRFFSSVVISSGTLIELDYPARLCARLLLNTSREWKRMHRKANLKKIIFALHDREVYEVFKELELVLNSGTLLSMPNFTGEDRVWKVTKVEIK